MSDNVIMKNIKTAAGTPFSLCGASNAPYIGGQQKQYFADSTKKFMREHLQYSSNLFAGKIQGVDYSDFYKWTDIRFRMSAVLDPTTGEHLSDDWQEIIIENPAIDSIPNGAYLYVDGNYWIVINPQNVGSVIGNAIMRRCNCYYCTYDYYGNVVQTPMSYSKGMALASANITTEFDLLAGTYQHCYMQYNEATRDFHNNSRLILGGDAYFATGVTNFIREYTEAPDSVHVIRFDARLGQVNETDDLENSVANGKAFSWAISIAGQREMRVGQRQTLQAASLRNQSAPDSVLHPYEYVWSTSNETVAKIDSKGELECVGVGEAIITCALAQNKNIVSNFAVKVNEQPMSNYVQFLGNSELSLEQYMSVTLNAGYFENGILQEDKPITFSFHGVRDECYGYVIDGNAVTLTCYKPSERPLVVKAVCEGQEATASVMLTGY